MKTIFVFLFLSAGLWAQINVRDLGAVGDGVTDDHAAFQLAADLRRKVIVPKGNYKLGDTVVFSTTHGQKLVGEGMSPGSGNAGTTRIIAPTGKPAFVLSGRGQEILHLSIWGDGTQTGVLVGPAYIPGWSIVRCSFHNLKIGVENRCTTSPGAAGSDQGSLRSSVFSGNETGYLDAGSVHLTLLDECYFGSAKIGVHCFGIGVIQVGGVSADCSTHLVLEDGASAALTGVFYEGLREDGDFAYVHAKVNNRVTVNTCVQNIHGNPNSRPFLWGASGCVVTLLGMQGHKFSANGNCVVFGKGEEVLYNGVTTYAAGDYIAQTQDNPLPAASLVGAKMLILPFGPVQISRSIQAVQTSAGNVEWVDILRREVFRNGNWIAL